MKKVNRVLYWGAICFLITWLVMPIIRMTSGLEFASDSVEYSYLSFLFFGVPAAVLMTLFGRLKKNHSTKDKIEKVVGTVIVALLAMFIVFMSFIGGMCGWTNNEVLYQKKDNLNTKIIIRDYGCGAWDGDSPTYKVFKVEHFTEYFIHAVEIDTNTIDKSAWVKVSLPEKKK